MEENTPKIPSPASDNIKNFILVSDLKFHGLSMILLSVWKLDCLGGLMLYKSFMMRQLIGFLISKLNLINWLFSYPWFRTNVNLLRSVWIDPWKKLNPGIVFGPQSSFWKYIGGELFDSFFQTWFENCYLTLIESLIKWGTNMMWRWTIRYILIHSPQPNQPQQSQEIYFAQP